MSGEASHSDSGPSASEPSVPGSVQVDGLWEGYRPGRRRRLPWRGDWNWALRGVDLDIESGEIVGVIGHNGSGKTTLLQSVAGVLRPTRGTVHTSGRVSSLVDLAAGFHRDLSGHENLLIGGVLLGMSRAEIRHRYPDIVGYTGLDESELDNAISTYSTGMGLRLGFALVACSAPSVILVDEVLAVGDEAFRRRCVDTIVTMVDAGAAAMLASHDMDLIAKHCDRVTVLDHGEQRFSGSVIEGIELYHELRGSTDRND